MITYTDELYPFRSNYYYKQSYHQNAQVAIACK